MRFGPLPDTTPLLPIINNLNAQYFVSPTDVDPWQIGNTEFVTSALRFGNSVDFLSLCKTDDAEPTDSIHPDIELDKIFYADTSGDVHVHDISLHPFARFNDCASGRFAEMDLTLTVYLSVLGVPTTFFGRAYHKVMEYLGRNKKVAVQLNGSINLQTGALNVNYLCHSFEIKLIGYTIKAYRENLNRRPVTAAGCPYMN